MLLSLGDFQFSVDTAVYSELRMKADYPWTTVDRLQNIPQYQAMGKETRVISLAGTVYPSYREAGLQQIEELRKAAAEMKPQYLMAGNGRYLGRWVVKSISQTDNLFFSDGAPQRQDFEIEMERFDL